MLGGMNMDFIRAKMLLNNLISEVAKVFDTQEDLEYYLRVEIGFSKEELDIMKEEYNISSLLPEKEVAV